MKIFNKLSCLWCFLNQIITDDMIDSIYTKAVHDMNFCGQKIPCQYANTIHLPEKTVQIEKVELG